MQSALNVPPGSKNPHEAWLASFEHNHLGDEAAPAKLQIYLARPMIYLCNITFTATVLPPLRLMYSVSHGRVRSMAAAAAWATR